MSEGLACEEGLLWRKEDQVMPWQWESRSFTAWVRELACGGWRGGFSEVDQ